MGGRSKSIHYGFTLLEMLLVILLLGLLLAGAYGSIHAATRAMHAGEQMIERTNRLRVTQEFLRHQISRALPLSFGQEHGSGSNYLFQGERDFMRFVSPMPGHLSHGGAYVQTLELANAAGGRQLIFTDHMLNGFDLDKLSNSDQEPVALLDQIREGRFEYANLNPDGTLGDWKERWEDSTQMPVMVRIALTMSDQAQTVWPNMEIPLLMESGGFQRPFGNQGFMPHRSPVRPGQQP